MDCSSLPAELHLLGMFFSDLLRVRKEKPTVQEVGAWLFTAGQGKRKTAYVDQEVRSSQNVNTGEASHVE